MTSPKHPISLRWWDLAAAVLLLVTGALGFIETLGGYPLWASERSDAARLVLTALPLAFLLALYAGLGRRALRRGMQDQSPDTASILFLALMLVALATAAAMLPLFAVLQTLAYPIAWSIVTRYRDAVLWSAGIAFATGVGIVAAIGERSLSTALASAAITVSLSFVFSVVMGTWITRIAAQGERYRALAEQLRASQAEVAELSAEAGASAERERLSRELHDTLTQTLAGLVMLGEQAERALEAGDTARGRERLARVGAAARDAVAEARALVAATQPLGDGGLEAAVERVATRFAQDTGLRVDCEIRPVSLDRERQVVLLRAAQEGLANARKHARAAHVRVTLIPAHSGGAVLSVEDDGVGPDPEAIEHGGFGLSGLSDRVRAVGGEVRFEPRDGGGAVLDVRVDTEKERA